MNVVLNVTLTPDELKSGAIELARNAAATAIANPKALAGLPCTSDIQATAPSTFAFDLTPAPPAPAAAAPAAT